MPGDGRALPPIVGASQVSSPGMTGLIPNSIKYSDRSLKNATGRAGNASITARALLGRDGAVDLEVTTGTLDGADTPPGMLEKVQVKRLGTEGGALWTLNYNKIGDGYWTTRYAGAGAGSRFQVQAGVSGFDRNRIGIVTLQETAKRRPDVTVTHLAAPAAASPNAPVEIAATIRELNGDVGARADCRLSVDGTEVDRANGIWVDASGTVTCAFTHAFSASGTRQLTVDVIGVTPGDWDDANNTMSRSIVIRTAQDFRYSAIVQEMTHDIRVADTATTVVTASSGETHTSYWASAIHEYGTSQVAIHTGEMPDEVAFPVAEVEFGHASNGLTLAAVVRNGVDRSWEFELDEGNGRRRWKCGDLWATNASAGRLYASICAIRFTRLDGQVEQRLSTFSHWRWAGDVTYRSSSHHRFRYQASAADAGTEYFYDYNYDVRNVDGMPLPTLGPTYDMTYRVTGADGRTHGSAAVVQLRPYLSTGGWPYACQSSSATWGDLVQTVTSCSSNQFTRSGTYGTAVGGP